MSAANTRPSRPLRQAAVVRTEPLTRDLVRVFLTGDDLRELPDLVFTDHYVKLLLPPVGAPYAAPFDPDQIRQLQPSQWWPVMRTYTIRSYEPATNELAIDFVVHGDDGVAGPWARTARPGDVLMFRGPGGAWAPGADCDGYVHVGDESAAPAIAAALERTPHNMPTRVYLEVADAGVHVPMPSWPGLEVRWVHRDECGGRFGQGLVEALVSDVETGGDGRRRVAGMPERLSWFVHGNADMIRPVRRLLRTDLDADMDLVSISGYWRPGHDEDTWQSTKRAFVADMQREQDAAASPQGSPSAAAAVSAD